MKTKICASSAHVSILAWRWEQLLLLVPPVQHGKPQLGTSFSIPEHLRGQQAEAEHAGALLHHTLCSTPLRRCCQIPQ